MKKILSVFMALLMISGLTGNFSEVVEATEYIAVNVSGEMRDYEKVELKVDGKVIEGDMPAILYKEFTMVPIKFVADAIGAETDWDNELREATITKSGITIKVKIGESKAIVNGVEKHIERGATSLIGNDRTLLPIRFIAEQLNFEVGWDNDTRSALLTSKTEIARDYKLYQENQLISEFSDIDNAITEGMKWGQSSIYYEDSEVWNYDANSNNYNLYQDSLLLGSYANYHNAILESINWTDSIINYKGNKIWSFDAYKNGYTVYQESMNLGSFETQSLATTEAKKWTGSKVMHKGEVVWTNIGNTSGNKKLIVIDAGHGGTDPGTISVTDKEEKDLSLNVALKLNEELQARGYDTIMTRTTDKTVKLNDRAPIANNTRADAFISVHFNSFTSPTATGIETHYYGKNGNDKQFSQCIQDRLIEATGAVNRGTKKTNFAVLRQTKMIAALLELGFISNPKDETILVSDSYHGLVAKAIAEGIDDYFKSF